MNFVIVNLGGLLLIGLIIGWFWWYRPKALRAMGMQAIEITMA